MSDHRLRIRFYLVFLAYGIVTLPFGAMYFLTRWFSPRNAYRLMQAWFQTWMDLCGASVFVEGLSRPDWDRPAVMVCNHLSYLDIPTAVLTCPVHVHFISTRGVGYIPIIASAMRHMQMIFIDRHQNDGRHAAIDEAARKIAEGRSVLSYPEGGISRDGKTAPFKNGLFRLAIKAGVPVLPIVLRGSRDVFDCIGKRSRPGRIEVEYLECVSTEGYTEDDAARLAEIVREKMLAVYGDGALRGVGVEIFKNPSR